MPHLPISAIDTHAHIFISTLPRAAGSRYSPDYDVTAQDYLAQLDANGCSHGVLVQPSFLGTDNRFMVAALRAHPDRLRGIAVVDTSITDAELDELDEAGVVGIRLNLVGRPLEDYAAPAWQAFFARIAARGWQVEIQRAFEDLSGIVTPILASGATVVLDHFGLPGGAIDPDRPEHAALLACMAHDHLWVKLSAPYRAKLSPEAAQAALAVLTQACGGTQRFMWGSDWPHTQHESQVDYASQVARMHALLPDPALRRQILATNPANLFRFP